MNTSFESDAALIAGGRARRRERRPAALAQDRAPGVRAALRGGWQRLWMDDRSAYLQ